MQVAGGENRGAVIVTGASRGIGAAIASLVAARGYPVVVNFLKNQAAADAVVSGIRHTGGRATAIRDQSQ